MKKLLSALLAFVIAVALCGCGTDSREQVDTNPPIETIEPTAPPLPSEAETITVQYGDRILVEGTLTKNDTGFPDYCLKLTEPMEITFIDGDLTEYFVFETLYFYVEPDYNGNYDFEKIVNSFCTVTACLENYRGAGNLYLFDPIITIDGAEATKNPEVPVTENSEPIQSRANGSWAHKVNYSDSMNLIIRSDGTFVATYNSFGEVEDMLIGTYEILSDDGQYQLFRFTYGTDTWCAQILQKKFVDSYGCEYEGIEYVKEDGTSIYYTGTKYID